MAQRQAMVNGKRVLIDDDTTAEKLRQMMPELGNETLLENGTKPLGPKDKIKPGTDIWGIPDIVKGVDDVRFNEEVKLLQTAAKGGSPVVTGTTTLDGVKFRSVIVKNVSLSTKKFNSSKTDILFLLPPDYPRRPPIGCYLNYPWETMDHHSTQRSFYGAPDLSPSGKDKGWYWYCVGLGGGFDAGAWGRTWRPGTQAANGDNLAKLFIVARYAINND